MRAIDVSGYRYCDIVLYLAGLLNAMGEKVFVRDLSEDMTLYKYLPKVERLGNDDIMELKGVLFAQGYKVIPEECTYCFDLQEHSSDTVFVKEDNSGDYRLFEDGEESEDDVDHSILFSVRNAGDYVGYDAVTVLRDSVGIEMKKFGNMFRGSSQNKVLRLPYSLKDWEAELYLTVRDDVNFLSVSEKMGRILEELVLRFRPETTGRQFEKAYREVMKGGAR